MEVEEALGPKPTFSVALLKMIHSAQLVHGLKHSEYSRYRQYCTRRLRRIYKSVKFLHGRGKFQAKRLDADAVTEERHIHIPLVSAERAWAHAMDVKNQVEQSQAPGKRHHLIRRLSKASTHATQLAALAAARCDARTSLEAEAYALWMSGNLLLEKETDWEAALSCFLKAGKLLEELSRLGDAEQRTTCRYFLDQVDPAARFCRYQISRAKGDGSNKELLEGVAVDAFGGDVIQSKLAALAAEAQASRAATLEAEFDWDGEKLPVRDDRCRVALHAAKELEAALPQVPEEGPATQEQLESTVAAYDRCINAYSAARAAVRSAAQLGGQGTDSHQAELTSLDRAVHVLELQHTIRRNLCLAENAAGRVQRAWKQQLTGTKSKDKERPARPDDVARLYDTLYSNANELNEVAAHVGGARGEGFMDGCAAKLAHYQAARCLFVAQSHLEAERWVEAASLLDRAQQRLAEAAARYKECSAPDQQGLRALQRLDSTAAALVVVPVAELHAQSLKEAGPVQTGLQGLGLANTSTDKGTATFLCDASDTWAAFAGEDNNAPVRIAHVPPHPEPVPVRPIVLDTALMCVEPPTLSHRLPQKAAAAAPTGMVSRLFGWGASS